MLKKVVLEIEKRKIFVNISGLPLCKKYDVVSDIANSEYETSPDARLCPSGNKTSHEALVMVDCGIGATNTWKKGENVSLEE